MVSISDMLVWAVNCCKRFPQNLAVNPHISVRSKVSRIKDGIKEEKRFLEWCGGSSGSMFSPSPSQCTARSEMLIKTLFSRTWSFWSLLLCKTSGKMLGMVFFPAEGQAACVDAAALRTKLDSKMRQCPFDELSSKQCSTWNSFNYNSRVPFSAFSTWTEIRRKADTEKLSSDGIICWTSLESRQLRMKFCVTENHRCLKLSAAFLVSNISSFSRKAADGHLQLFTHDFISQVLHAFMGFPVKTSAYSEEISAPAEETIFSLAELEVYVGTVTFRG